MSPEAERVLITAASLSYQCCRRRDRKYWFSVSVSAPTELQYLNSLILVINFQHRRRSTTGDHLDMNLITGRAARSAPLHKPHPTHSQASVPTHAQGSLPVLLQSSHCRGRQFCNSEVAPSPPVAVRDRERRRVFRELRPDGLWRSHSKDDARRSSDQVARSLQGPTAPEPMEGVAYAGVFLAAEGINALRRLSHTGANSYSRTMKSQGRRVCTSLKRIGGVLARIQDVIADEGDAEHERYKKNALLMKDDYCTRCKNRRCFLYCRSPRRTITRMAFRTENSEYFSSKK